MKHTPEHGYIPVSVPIEALDTYTLTQQQLPNYFAESLSKVRRFHDPGNGSDYPSLSRTSSHDSLDSLNISDKTSTPKEFGTITNTVKAVEQEGPHKGQSKTFQLPSLITPVSLFGKRIRYSCKQNQKDIILTIG